MSFLMKILFTRSNSMEYLTNRDLDYNKMHFTNGWKWENTHHDWKILKEAREDMVRIVGFHLWYLSTCFQEFKRHRFEMCINAASSQWSDTHLSLQQFFSFKGLSSSVSKLKATFEQNSDRE
ncbi:uncharacterized protein LOC132056555 [Lycium ferocissimum]|uniref:uncharacterized protein LOC132056555 n=1 Tax=Lycium ferocissimum TaxID=112874 RepID=UPI002815B0DD|nr:uncharacterized protein LOC132056555 [Lycium ferocissimum]XP_059304801.1 uncharacterized protein LOC132056555 [Lycium ferocissimum]